MNRIVLCIITGTITVYVIQRTIILTINQKPKTTKFYNILTLSLFASTATLCFILLGMLIYIIKKKNFSAELSKERSQLIICQSIFVISFTIRTTLVVAVQYNAWVDFSRDYPTNMHYTLFLPLSFIVYNILPYLTMIYMHLINFNPNRQNNPSTPPHSSQLYDNSVRDEEDEELTTEPKTVNDVKDFRGAR